MEELNHREFMLLNVCRFLADLTKKLWWAVDNHPKLAGFLWKNYYAIKVWVSFLCRLVWLVSFSKFRSRTSSKSSEIIFVEGKEDRELM